MEKEKKLNKEEILYMVAYYIENIEGILLSDIDFTKDNLISLKYRVGRFQLSREEVPMHIQIIKRNNN